MKCRLCAQPTAGPDKLCVDCIRALKRAREGSAALRELPLSQPSLPEPMQTPALTVPLTLTSAPPPGWRRVVAWGAASLMAIGVIYLAQREPDRPRAPEPALAEDRSPASSVEAADVGAAPVSLEVLSTTRSKTAEFPARPAPGQATATQRASPRPADPATIQALARPRAGTRTVAVLAKSDSSSRTASSLDMAGNDTSPKDPNPGTGSDAEASQQLARVALVPQPASARDGAPVLASALEKCGQEKFLAGVVCEQKVRLQYCEGKWGQVPECTGKGRAE